MQALNCLSKASSASRAKNYKNRDFLKYTIGCSLIHPLSSSMKPSTTQDKSV